MKSVRIIRSVMVSLSLVGLCIPTVALAGPPASEPAVVDIALADGGTLHGRVIDLEGGNVTGIPVSLQTQDREVVSAVTVSDGQFSVKGLQGGVYHVAAGQGQGSYRLWSPGTAPPAAHNDAIVYTQNGHGGGGIKMLLSNPIVIAGIVATAIAVPVALANSRSSSP